MIVLVCPYCLSTQIKKDEERIAGTGQDWFKCKECCHGFPLRNTEYREESDIFD